MWDGNAKRLISNGERNWEAMMYKNGRNFGKGMRNQNEDKET